MHATHGTQWDELERSVIKFVSECMETGDLSGKVWVKPFSIEWSCIASRIDAANLVFVQRQKFVEGLQIEPLVPANAKKDDHGNKGYSFETGIIFDWEVV